MCDLYVALNNVSLLHLVSVMTLHVFIAVYIEFIELFLAVEFDH